MIERKLKIGDRKLNLKKMTRKKALHEEKGKAGQNSVFLNLQQNMPNLCRKL